MMPGRSVSSANFSGVVLKETPVSLESADVTVNIFPPTEKQRSDPHFMSSVTPGNDMQNLRSCSMFIFLSLANSSSFASGSYFASGSPFGNLASLHETDFTQSSPSLQ